MAEECAAIRDLSDEARFKAYLNLGESLIAKQDAAGLDAFFDNIVTKEGVNQFGRTYIVNDLIQAVCNQLIDQEGKLEVNLELEDIVPVGTKLVTLLQGKADAYPDAYFAAINLLASAHQALGNWQQAASTRNLFNLAIHGDQVSMSPEDRVAWQVTTAELYLKTGPGSAGQAHMALQRAIPSVSLLKGDAEARLRYMITYARVVDQLSRFAEAGARYCEIADMPVGGLITEGRRNAAVSSAVLYAVLSPIGTSRTTLLTKLHADARTRKLPLFTFMEKVLFQRLLSSEDLSVLKSQLSPHHNAVGASGRPHALTCWMEHNVLAASRLYRSISLQGLGELLGLSPEDAEDLAADMISSDKLAGRIDQTEGCLEFASSTSHLSTWDRNLAALCKQVNECCDAVVKLDKKRYSLK